MARYELLERIGVGGMAEIFRGMAVAGGGFEKPVAIKRILPHLSQDQRFVELLIAEAKILSELRHRNIVQIYDVGLGDDGQYFLVMEFVDGTDLGHVYEDLFGGRKLPVEVSLHICAELCEALEHAHIAKDEHGVGLGLVHRDVSPSNVLLSKSGEVKLTDFGIAKRVEEVTGHGGVRGKFAYISPEQAANRHVDARSDVFSLGILLYELACGQRLFSGLEDFDALREVREGRVHPAPENVPGLERGLAKLISKSLSKAPEDRFQSAGDFGAALRGYRYSLDTELADPMAAIAELVNPGGAATRDDSDDSLDDFGPDHGMSTIVRIDTAADFANSDLSGMHSLITSYPVPRIDDTPSSFDEMETASLNINRLAAASHDDEELDDEELDDEQTQARTKLFEEPTEHDDDKTVARRNPLLEKISPAKGTVDSRFDFHEASAAATDGRSASHGAHHRPQSSPGPHIPPHYPGYGGRFARQTDEEANAKRFKIRLAIAAGAIAIIAFVVAGHHLDNSGKAQQTATSVEEDAGAVVDASYPDAGVLDAAPKKVRKSGRNKANRRRKNKRRRGKKRRRR